MKKLLVLFLIIGMCCAFCACSAKTENTESLTESVADSVESESATEETDYSIKYDMKINPEFTIYADEDLHIVRVEAENEDAQAVLSCVDVQGLSVSDAFTLLTEEAKAQGYMTEEKGNTVDISILEKDDEAMPTCHVCGGCGTVICAECNGTGIACSCDRCKGTGINHYAAGPECWSCAGSGICPECGGSGQIVVTNGEDGGVVYIAEGVPEMGQCPACLGNGVCGNCHGGDYSAAATDDVCEGCQGSGVLYCHDDLNGYSWCPCCWGSGIEGTGDPNYAD